MLRSNIDWTHKSIIIKDVRKLNKLYVIKVYDPDRPSQIDMPLFVKDTIFEERLKSYFLKPVDKISRDEILNSRWNMYITKGYYIKVDENNDIQKFNNDPEKWYVSYLEIEGALANFLPRYEYKEKETNTNLKL